MSLEFRSVFHRQRRAIGACVILGFLAFPDQNRAQSQPSPWSAVAPETPVKTVAALLWKTILTQCPVVGASPLQYSYFYAGLPNEDRTLYEYREPNPRIQPNQLSTADKLNGVQWRGTAIWTAGAYRSWTARDGRWSEWKDLQSGSLDVTAVLTSPGGRRILQGSLIAFLEKKRSQWSVSIASSGPAGIKREPFDSTAFWSARTPCDAATSANPFAAEADRIRREDHPSRTEKREQGFVDRDLGDTLLCKGTMLYTRSPTSFPSTTGKESAATILVQVVGANEDGGVLWNELRVKPVKDSRWATPPLSGLTSGTYFVPMSAIRDSCPDYRPRNPGLVSNITLAHGLRAAGSLDRWAQELAERAEPVRNRPEEAAVAPKDFADMLSEAVKKRGPEFGVDPAQYGDAMKVIVDIVRVCSSISAPEFAASMDQNGIPQLLRYKDGKYSACIPNGVWRSAPDGNQVPGFLISLDLLKRWNPGTKEWDGPKFRIEVYLKETHQSIPISIQEYQRRYILLSADIKDTADIPSAPSAAQLPTVVKKAASAPSGLAVLTILGGFAEPLTVGHYWLLRDDPEIALKKGGIRISGGMTPNEVMRAACERSEAACKKITLALDEDGIAKVVADATGRGTFPGVPPGNYYLMISAVYNNRLLLWNQRVELKSGQSSTVFTSTMQQR